MKQRKVIVTQDRYYFPPKGWNIISASSCATYSTYSGTTVWTTILLEEVEQ